MPGLVSLRKHRALTLPGLIAVVALIIICTEVGLRFYLHYNEAPNSLQASEKCTALVKEKTC